MTSAYPGLSDYPQFVIYIVRPRLNKPGKTDKFPINPTTGRAADPTDPTMWLTLEAAQRYVAAGTGEGVGFVFTATDPFFFLDIDGAYDAANRSWSVDSAALCAQFPGCFIEVSHSGTGLHIIGSAPLAPPHGTRCNERGLELYSSGRFVALTGKGASGTALTDATPAISQLITLNFPPPLIVAPEEWSAEPVAEWSGPATDAALMKKMLSSTPSAAAAFQGKATIAQLMAGDLTSSLGDASGADQALCNHLAFWTGQDCERMDGIFRTSKLMRDKWDENRGPRGTYGVITILNAISHCENVYHDGKLPEVDAINERAPAPADSETGVRVDYQFLSISAQIDHFEGCVYLDDVNDIWCPDGKIRDQKRFKVYRGGYAMALDSRGDKTTKDAFEAFTLSQGYDFPKADSACFRPENEAGAIVVEEGFRLLNTYFPIETRRIDGDPEPFLDLMARLLPIDRDREILISYMAAVTQYPGEKFQWWPVVQGVKGNGKSALMRVMLHAVGSRYSHKPNAEAMIRSGNQFNSWIERKLFVGIDEFKASDQRGFLESFKTIVTEDRIQVEGKGANQAMGDNRANGLITTNHKDGAPIDDEERRYCIFFTAQQAKADLLRDGMTLEYFYTLYEWLKADGCAIVNNYLRNFEIADEFNPATLCKRAPETSSTKEAIHAARGRVEQHIEEAINEGRPGFNGGWISGFALDILLEEKRFGGKITHLKRIEILEKLGFVTHTALTEGRVNNAFTDPGSGKTGKPRLFLKVGHLALAITSPAAVVRQYEKAQTDVPTAVGLAFADEV